MYNIRGIKGDVSMRRYNFQFLWCGALDNLLLFRPYIIRLRYARRQLFECETLLHVCIFYIQMNSLQVLPVRNVYSTYPANNEHQGILSYSSRFELWAFDILNFLSILSILLDWMVYVDIITIMTMQM